MMSSSRPAHRIQFPSKWIVAVSAMLFALLQGCSGDPRSLEEAIEANTINLTRLVISSEITSTNQLFINPGERLQLDFDAFSGDTQIEVSNVDRRWSVSDSSVASISRSGLLVGENNGTVDVVVRIGGIISEPLSISVSDAQLTAIASITGDDALIECAISGDYTALGLFSDASERELRNVDWSVVDADSGVLLQNLPATAVVGALLPGTITLQATVDGIQGSRDITVEQGLDSLAIVPEAITIERGASLALVASANYTDGSTALVSELVTWSVDADNGFVTLSQATGETGVLSGVSVGPTILSANCGDAERVANVNVVAPQLIVSVEIEDSEDPLVLNANGASEQLRLFATSDAGSVEEVTNSANWTITADTGTNTVELDNTGTERGEVTPLNTGQVTITASFRGEEDTITVIVQ